MKKFDMEDIMALVETIKTPKAEVVAVEKVRIRAYSPEYTEWLASDEPSTPDSQESCDIFGETEWEHETQCSSCSGTGQYIGARWSRPCLTCAGKGRIDEKRAKHNAVYQSVKGTSVQRKTYKDYTNPTYQAVAA